MAGFSTVVVVLPVFWVGGLAVQMEKDLGMTATALGAAVAVFWGGSAVIFARAASVAQWLGPRLGMLLTVAVGLVSLLDIAFAPRTGDGCFAGRPSPAWPTPWTSNGL